jgi:hypothetical protein
MLASYVSGQRLVFIYGQAMSVASRVLLGRVKIARNTTSVSESRVFLWSRSFAWRPGCSGVVRQTLPPVTERGVTCCADDDIASGEQCCGKRWTLGFITLSEFFSTLRGLCRCLKAMPTCHV